MVIWVPRSGMTIALKINSKGTAESMDRYSCECYIKKKLENLGNLFGQRPSNLKSKISAAIATVLRPWIH